jgi:hypothetical protein
MAHAGFMIEFNRPIAYRARLIFLLEQFGLAVEEIGKTVFTLQ